MYAIELLALFTTCFGGLETNRQCKNQWRLVVFFAGGARLYKTGCGRKYLREPHPKSDIG